MTNDNKLTLSLEDFHPAKEALNTLVERAKATDIANLDQVHETRIMLRDARVQLTKRGKEMREGAMKFQKDVIAKEKELVAIIEPEEARLEKAEEELKLRKAMEERRAELPARLAALASIGDSDLVVDEQEILAMNDTEFNEHRLRLIDAKLMKDKQAHEEKVRADEEAARIRRDAEEKERREKLAAEEAERRAKLEAEEKESRAKREAEEKALSAEREKLAAERAKVEAEKKAAEEAEQRRLREIEMKEREARLKEEEDRKAAEKKAKEEADRMREEKFLAWQKEIGYDPKTDIMREINGTIQAYRLIGAYDPKKK